MLTLRFRLSDTLLNLLFGQDFDCVVREDIAHAGPDGGGRDQIPTKLGSVR
jgi:hypothetical protein